MYSQLWDEWAPTSERGELLAFTLSGKPTGLLKIKLNLIITNTDMANLRLYFISLRSVVYITNTGINKSGIYYCDV